MLHMNELDALRRYFVAHRMATAATTAKDFAIAMAAANKVEVDIARFLLMSNEKIDEIKHDIKCDADSE